MSLILESRAGEFKPHVEGIHPAVCVDVIDLGLVELEFQGQRRLVNRVRLFFETEQRNEEGKNCIISKTFTASLHPKAKLADFLGKWRGRPVVPGESIDLAKLIGACCTLVISHQQNMVGRTYASVDAVSKPTKRLVPSGSYDPVVARQRIAEWSLRTANRDAASVPGGGPNAEVASLALEVRSSKSETESSCWQREDHEWTPRMPLSPLPLSPSDGERGTSCLDGVTPGCRSFLAHPVIIIFPLRGCSLRWLPPAKGRRQRSGCVN